jgi:PBP1b-binding outer membrane lipoprotein LpoB
MKYFILILASAFLLNGCSDIVNTEMNNRSVSSRATPSEVNNKVPNEDNQIQQSNATAKTVEPSQK